ncbi:MAG: hypothetical protein JWQ21_2964 [Herminiimonas sp.]|nr:hypothetical protein [Herminiimonas sp.]
MKKTIINPVLIVLTASVLLGCGKDVPSCGDVEATNMVSQILAENVTKDTGALEDEFKKRVHFEVEQPVVLAHDEKVSSYSCKGIAMYKVPDGILEKLQRSTQDKKFETELWSNWRKLIGYYSADDVAELAKEFNDATEKNSPKKDDLRAELAQVVGVDKNSDFNLLMGSVMAYPIAQRNKEIQENANLLQQVLKSVDENTKKVPVEVQYTISKIDGSGKKFKIEAKSNSDMLHGIQNVEALQSAALLAELPPVAATQPAKIQAKSVEAQPATTQVQAVAAQPAATQPVVVVAAPPAAVPIQPAEVKKPETKMAPQGSSETKPQTAMPPEPQKVSIEASFDCAKASAKIEKLICSSPETANADKRLSATYSSAKAKSGDEKKLKTEQLEWIKQKRNACDDAACLVKVTEDRIQTLSR